MPGNLTTDSYSGAGTRTYDAENRITQAWGGNNQWQYYTYNADGQRTRRKVDNVETWQVYGMDSELLAEYAPNAAAASPQKEYGYRNGQLLITAAPNISANVALNKTATQSSDDWGGVASRAVDGNSDGNWANNSVTHTLTQSQAWWKVDLGSTQSVQSVEVFNRTDCCSDRLTNFNVILLDASQAVVATVNVPGQGGTPSTVQISGSARYVKVQLVGTSVLSLAEVKVWATGSAENMNWLVSDQLGTPRMIFDRTGSFTSTKRHDYLPFGEEISAFGGRTTTQGYVVDAVRQKFTSKERDNETGMDYFGARFYASTQGRFIGVDPIFISRRRLLDPQAINLYAYVRNNPLSYFDPDGEQFKGTDGKKIDIVAVDGQLIIKSENATKEVIRLVNLINNSGSSTSLSQFNQLNASKTMINLTIDASTGGTRIGLHEPHGTKPDGSKGALHFDDATNKFDGQVDTVKDANGNEVYAEATITLFEGELTDIYEANTEAIEDELVATFGHEAQHDLDPRQIQATKAGTGTDAIYHPTNRDGTPASGSPYWMTYKILNEIKIIGVCGVFNASMGIAAKHPNPGRSVEFF